MRLHRRQAAPAGRHRIVQEEPAQPPVAFSYASNVPRQPGAQAPAARTKPDHSWLSRLGLMVFLVAFTALAVNVVSLAASPKVVLLGSNSQSYLRPSQAYSAAVNKVMTSSAWNRNKITLNTGQISRQLLSQFPEISSVSVTVPLSGHQATVYIQPAQPVLVLSSSNGSFVIDSAGKALLSASDAVQPFKDLPVLTDQSGLKVSLNRQALPVSNIKFIRVILSELADKQVSVSSMTLPAASSELDVHLGGQSYYVKFNLQDSDPRGEAGTFLATVASLKKQNITPGQYVDVRVSGRAYYQ